MSVPESPLTLEKLANLNDNKEHALEIYACVPPRAPFAQMKW